MCQAELTPRAASPSVVKRARGYCLACTKGYYETRRSEDLSRHVRYRQEHRQELAQYAVRYRKDHKEKVNACNTRQRARRADATGLCTASSREARWNLYGGLCYLCGRPAEAMDHVIPLSRGGTNWPANIRPICKECNSKKGSKWPYPITAKEHKKDAQTWKDTIHHRQGS